MRRNPTGYRAPGAQLVAIDLFAGSGGMSLGLEAAGFKTLGVELDPQACRAHQLGAGPCIQEDARKFSVRGEVDLVAAGFPCQTYSFSRGGGRPVEDRSKRLFPEAFRVAVETRSPALLFENVKGLNAAVTEDGTGIIRVLYATAEHAGYHLQHRVLNAADYGVPQIRERLIFVGFREYHDAMAFQWPSPTHSERKWRTVRDVLPHVPYDAPAPTIVATEAKSIKEWTRTDAKPRRGVERISQGMGGSRFDPSPQELALLQGYPRGYPFQGSRTEQMRQVGNSVPPPLAEAVARQIALVLRRSS